jgi:hypothetical protein
MKRLWSGVAAVSGLILGIGPALLTHVFPQAALLNQFNVAMVGAIIGARAGIRRPGCPVDLPADREQNEIGIEGSSR